MAHEIPDFGGAGAETRQRIDRAEQVYALHQLALDLTDTEQIEVSTNGTARLLKTLLIRMIADEKTGERVNVCTSCVVNDAAQPVTKGIARAAARSGS